MINYNSNILGIGTDIVEISRVASLWEKYDIKFAKKILAASELEELVMCKNPVNMLAKRFAMKEAVVKALGSGFRGDLWFTNIFISHDKLGKPEVNFISLNRKINAELHITVADEKKYVVAFAVATKIKLDKLC